MFVCFFQIPISLYFLLNFASCFYFTSAEAVVSVCVSSLDARELRFSRAMVFAVEEINNSAELLPGVRLGYQIHDSCASVPVTVHAAFQLSNGQDPVFYTGVNCSQSGSVVAVVGESGSTPSISMARVIGSFNIPLVNTLDICFFILFVCFFKISFEIRIFLPKLTELHCHVLL